MWYILLRYVKYVNVNLKPKVRQGFIAMDVVANLQEKIITLENIKKQFLGEIYEVTSD